MNSRFYLAIMLSLSIVSRSGPAWAQHGQASADATADEAADEYDVPQAVEVDATPPTPPPGPEVMRPTEHGFKFSPRWFELIGKHSAAQMEKQLKLNPEQKARFQDLIVQGSSDLQRRRGRELATAFEHLLEGNIEHSREMSPESARQLSDKLRPALPVVTEYMDNLERGAREFLDDSQFEEFNKSMGESRELVKRMEKRLDSWDRGEVGKGGMLHQLFEKEEPQDKKAVDKQEAESKPARSDALIRAEQRYDRALREWGPESWRLVLMRCRQVFGYSPEQYRRGEEILEEYRKQADEIMTPEWRRLVRVNRMKTHAKKVVQNEPLEPWLYHLDRDFEEMVKPIKELGRACRAEIIGLATDEQRAAVLTQLRKFGAEHGMAVQDMTPEFLHLTATQPEGH